MSRRYAVGWQAPNGHVRIEARDTPTGTMVERVTITGDVPVDWFAALDPVAAIDDMRPRGRGRRAA